MPADVPCVGGIGQWLRIPTTCPALSGLNEPVIALKSSNEGKALLPIESGSGTASSECRYRHVNATRLSLGTLRDCH
jgi:hypothetical protein